MGVTVQERWAAPRRAARGWAGDVAVAWQALWWSRAVVWIAGLGAIGVWGVHASKQVAFDPTGVTRPWGALGDLLVGPAARWDSVWFIAIADSGYGGDDRAAFFPLYPLLVRIGGALVGSPLLAAVALSFVLFLAALTVFHRLAVLEIGADGARWAVLGIALFPGSLWFSAAYSESLFLLVSVGAVLAARQRRWVVAGLLGALAAATRSAGLLLLVPLALLWLDARRAQPESARVIDLAWLGLVPVGLGAFCAYLALAGHAADAPFAAQDTWHRTFAWPWGGVRDGVVAAWEGARQLAHGSAEPVYFTQAGGDPMDVARHNLMLLAFLALAAVGLVGAIRRLRVAHWAYALVALSLPLSYPVGPQPLMSLPRFVAVLYPLFLWLGWWLARGPAWRRHAVLGTFTAGLAAFSMLFSTWHWVA